MPTLNWIGKEAVVEHHKDVPFRLLKPVAGLSCGPADSGNLIVQGDNLHALKALLPRYAGQVKCSETITTSSRTGYSFWVTGRLSRMFVSLGTDLVLDASKSIMENKETNEGAAYHERNLE